MARITDTTAPRLHVHFGAMAPPLTTQIHDQFPELDLNGTDVSLLQRLAEAQVLLSVHGLLTDSQKRTVQKKLFDRVSALVRERRGVLKDPQPVVRTDTL